MKIILVKSDNIQSISIIDKIDKLVNDNKIKPIKIVNKHSLPTKYLHIIDNYPCFIISAKGKMICISSKDEIIQFIKNLIEVHEKSMYMKVEPYDGFDDYCNGNMYGPYET